MTFLVSTFSNPSQSVEHCRTHSRSSSTMDGMDMDEYDIANCVTTCESILIEDMSLLTAFGSMSPHGDATDNEQCNKNKVDGAEESLIQSSPSIRGIENQCNRMTLIDLLEDHETSSEESSDQRRHTERRILSSLTKPLKQLKALSKEAYREICGENGSLTIDEERFVYTLDFLTPWGALGEGFRRSSCANRRFRHKRLQTSFPSWEGFARFLGRSCCSFHYPENIPSWITKKVTFIGLFRISERFSTIFWISWWNICFHIPRFHTIFCNIEVK